jgi:UDP-glucose:(glucosyl)LPS alpha-1,2-glucosyltransferase
MGGIAWSAGSSGSSGGTEQMGRALERRLPAELLGRFQIHLSWCQPAEPGKIQVLWCHMRHTHEAFRHLADGGWRRFHFLVFVSHMQAQGFIEYFDIPWSRCAVMPNAIEPVSVGEDRFEPIPDGRPIRLIYTSVPNRGLVLLYHAFKEMARQRDDVELDVFSSFGLYGWPDRKYEELFDALRRVPRVTSHGAVPNEQVRKALLESHVFAFPSILHEVSCLSLIEAMSAGLACVHPDFGSLPETAGGMTMMYHFHEDPAAHVRIFYEGLVRVVDAVRAGDPGLLSRLAAQKSYADFRYNWDSRAPQWDALLRRISQAD